MSEHEYIPKSIFEENKERFAKLMTREDLESYMARSSQKGYDNKSLMDLVSKKDSNINQKLSRLDGLYILFKKYC